MMKKTVPVLILLLFSLSCARVEPMPSWYDPKETPLVEAVFQASRQKNVGASLEYIEQATELIEKGADVKEKGSDGRTALHWVVVGAIYSNKAKLDEAYWELAELLIANGADVNAEDNYGNTPLDWAEVASNEEIADLLIANGAQNGFSQDEIARINRLIDKLYAASDSGNIEEVRAILGGDVRPGTQILIRLITPVSSRSSRAGDPVEASVIAPVAVNDRVVVPPGTKVEGTVLYAESAPNLFSQAELDLEFTTLVHPDGSKTRIVTHITAVDNAKETVDEGRIVGTQARTQNNKVAWAERVMGWVTAPLMVVGPFIEAVTFGYAKYAVQREIVYEPGVEMTLTVLAPERLNNIPEFKGWPLMQSTPYLLDLVNSLPTQVQTKDNSPSDVTNVMLIGSREDAVAAFEAAGWVQAAKLKAKTGWKSFIALMRDKGYEEAPFSKLYLDGKEPDLEFQKMSNTFAKRHHVRIWKLEETYQGQEVWLGGGTHDIGYGVSRAGTKWIHLVDPLVDRERDKIRDDLMHTGLVKGYLMVERPNLPRKNPSTASGGTNLITDGKMLVLDLGSDKKEETVSSNNLGN